LDGLPFVVPEVGADPLPRIPGLNIDDPQAREAFPSRVRPRDLNPVHRRPDSEEVRPEAGGGLGQGPLGAGDGRRLDRPREGVLHPRHDGEGGTRLDIDEGLAEGVKRLQLP
jgi:hypothetical protein